MPAARQTGVRMPMIRLARAAALAGSVLLGLAAAGPAPAADAFTEAEKAAIGDLVKTYIMEHPEIIQDALVALEEKKKAAEAAEMTAAISGMKDVLYSSTRQVVLGDPNAPITLVEFFDYNCGYCKRALDDTLAMLEEDKDVKIVLKEFPILGPGSVEAARVAVAVNLVAPEKYVDFHKGLLGAKGHADEASALAVVEEIGLDVEAVKAKMKDPEVANTLEEVYTMANRLGLSGTPTYVIGDEVVFGAVGVEDLRVKVAAMRECGQVSC
jgi:protein-disulfide isomerase